MAANGTGTRTILADAVEALQLVSPIPVPIVRHVNFSVIILEHSSISSFRGLADSIQVFRLTWRRNIVAWIYVPAGIMVMLLACLGINSLIGLSSVSFPASVACMIILFFFLIILDITIGNRKTSALVHLIDIPVCIDDLWADQCG